MFYGHQKSIYLDHVSCPALLTLGVADRHLEMDYASSCYPAYDTTQEVALTDIYTTRSHGVRTTVDENSMDLPSFLT